MVNGDAWFLLSNFENAIAPFGYASGSVLLSSVCPEIAVGQDGTDLLIVNNGDGSDFLDDGRPFGIGLGGINPIPDPTPLRYELTNISRFKLSNRWFYK